MRLLPLCLLVACEASTVGLAPSSWQFRSVAVAERPLVGSVGMAATDGMRVVSWDESELDSTGDVVKILAYREGSPEEATELAPLRGVQDVRGKPSVEGVDGRWLVSANVDGPQGREVALFVKDVGRPRQQWSVPLEPGVDHGRSNVALHDDGGGLVCASAHLSDDDERLVCRPFRADGRFGERFKLAVGAHTDHADITFDPRGRWRIGVSFAPFDGGPRTVGLMFEEHEHVVRLARDKAATDIVVAVAGDVLSAAWVEDDAEGQRLKLAHCASHCATESSWTHQVLARAPYVAAPSIAPSGLNAWVLTWSEGAGPFEAEVLAARVCGPRREVWSFGEGSTHRGQPSLVVDGHRVDVGFAAATEPPEVMVVSADLPPCP